MAPPAMSAMQANIRYLVFILIAIWLPIADAKTGAHEPFEVTGNVIKNNDGDTIKLKTADRGIINVRISGADTPETGQAYWKAARSYADIVSSR
jgi:endonuclease YncB( thermonuclease family)